MSHHLNTALGAAVALAIGVATSGSAFALAICGSRIFPATLGIDDPGVGDELDVYLDDIFPNSLGKPFFGASR